MADSQEDSQGKLQDTSCIKRVWQSPFVGFFIVFAYQTYSLLFHIPVLQRLANITPVSTQTSLFLGFLWTIGMWGLVLGYGFFSRKKWTRLLLILLFAVTVVMHLSFIIVYY